MSPRTIFNEIVSEVEARRRSVPELAHVKVSQMSGLITSVKPVDRVNTMRVGEAP